ncbi:NYN domain-containing protein [Nocardioides sp. Y6]|uniref:NYN domain-containing protein n=1 Tax=Nocardioides malaquae TaxID=2773426 RepID=A0ABR9RTA1_9ACTN|nr:NYN domain-containing protein [Nocardioides malaquae]MBE7324392.1 NYN domain-containing protein [Nocardioides malaquae]
MGQHDAGGRLTYVLVDGENIDATLGNSILGRRPRPEERPRWDRVLEWAEQAFEQEARGLFFLAVNDDLPMPFIQALTAIGFRPVPLRGEGKVVDTAIQRTAEAIAAREADVALVSHDGDFLPQVRQLCDGTRHVALVGFGEFVNAGFRGLPGLRVVDMEHDVRAFNSPLPRIRIIGIDEFDPLEFL